jgi:SAM-dependent methyltransferase
MNALPFACPRCRVPLDASTSSVTCARCGRSYAEDGGIYRFLDADPEVERFHHQYQLVRAEDGSRRHAEADIRRLPDVASDDPHAGEWAIRKQSFERLRHLLSLPPSAASARRVADLGAGNGWLSYRLAQAGWHAFAVDRLDDDADGLGACRHYGGAVIAVQADFNALPFEGGAFEAVVLNGSLHYSAVPAATLAEARRVLSPGGSLVVMDSPMFTRPDDGEAMVARQLRRITRGQGIAAPIRPGVGFLTFEAMDTAARALGLRARFTPSRGPLGWRVRREMGRLRLRRAPAAFGVWVAR